MRHSKGKDVTARLRWFSAWALVSLCLHPQIAPARDLIVAVKSLQAEPYELAFQGFRETLRRKGYDVDIKEYVLREGERERARLLSELKARRPALILTVGSSATSVIREQVQDLPVVFCMVLDPVASGFVQSMHTPGSNVTGASMDIPARLQFETLKAVVPSIKKVGVLYNPQETGEVVRPAAKGAAEVGLELIASPLDSSEKLQDALENLQRRVDALWSVADSTVFASDRSIEFLLRQTLQHKIPFMGLSPAFVKAGALLALSVDYRDVGNQCAEQTAQILAGRAPSSLPVTTPRKVTLYINLNAARTIGVEIPPSSMAEAVILK